MDCGITGVRATTNIPFLENLMGHNMVLPADVANQCLKYLRSEQYIMFELGCVVNWYPLQPGVYFAQSASPFYTVCARKLDPTYKET